MKNLLIIRAGDACVADIIGTVTKQGVETGTSKTGKKYARFTVTVPSNERDVKNANFRLGTKDKPVTLNVRDGEKGAKLLFVRAVAYDRLAELVAKHISAGRRIRLAGVSQINEFNGKQDLSVTVNDLPDYVGPVGKTADADIKDPEVPAEPVQAPKETAPTIEEPADSDLLPWEM